MWQRETGQGSHRQQTRIGGVSVGHLNISRRCFEPDYAGLEKGRLASVEHMRQILIEFLSRLQADLRGGDLGLIDQFYNDGQHVSENDGTKRIINWLRPRL